MEIVWMHRVNGRKSIRGRLHPRWILRIVSPASGRTTPNGDWQPSALAIVLRVKERGAPFCPGNCEVSTALKYLRWFFRLAVGDLRRRWPTSSFAGAEFPQRARPPPIGFEFVEKYRKNCPRGRRRNVSVVFRNRLLRALIRFSVSVNATPESHSARVDNSDIVHIPGAELIQSWVTAAVTTKKVNNKTRGRKNRRFFFFALSASLPCYGGSPSFVRVDAEGQRNGSRCRVVTVRSLRREQSRIVSIALLQSRVTS